MRLFNWFSTTVSVILGVKKSAGNVIVLQNYCFKTLKTVRRISLRVQVLRLSLQSPCYELSNGSARDM